MHKSYVFGKLFVFLFIISTGALVMLARVPDETQEQNFQRRLADMSAKPYVDMELGKMGYETATVVAILDDLPKSPQVRVIMRRGHDGLFMTALHPRCAGLVTGQEVELTYVDYKSTEAYMADSFYINE